MNKPRFPVNKPRSHACKGSHGNARFENITKSMLDSRFCTTESEMDGGVCGGPWGGVGVGAEGEVGEWGGGVGAEHQGQRRV